MRLSYVAMFVLISMCLLAVVAAPTYALPRRKFIRGEVRNVADYLSIQEAIDSLPAAGGTVFIPAGIHVISVSIKVPSHVSLVGAGFDTVLVLADGANVNVIENMHPSVWLDENIIVANLRIDGNGAAQDSAVSGIFLYTVPNSRVENVWLHDFPKYTTSSGVFLMLSSNSIVRNVVVGNNSYAGIIVSYSDNCWILNNYLIKNHRGIYISFSDHTIVRKNTIVDCDEGIRLYGDSSHNRIMHNHIEGSSDEGIVILHETCENNFLVNNRIINCTVPINDLGANTKTPHNKVY